MKMLLSKEINDVLCLYGIIIAPNCEESMKKNKYIFEQWEGFLTFFV